MKWTLVLLSAILLFGCTRGYKTVIGGQIYAPVPQEHVTLLLQFPDEGTYKVIGIVTAKGAALASDNAVHRKFQKAAADLGADAVVIGQEAMAYRWTAPGYGYTTGGVNIYRNGSQYYGDYSGTTTYSPPTPIYGLDVKGVAIRYIEQSTPTVPENRDRISSTDGTSP